MFLYVFGCEEFSRIGDHPQACVILAAHGDREAMVSLEIELVKADIAIELFLRHATMVRIPLNPCGIDLPRTGCVLATVNIHAEEQRMGAFVDPSDDSRDRSANPRTLATLFSEQALDILCLTERHAHWQHLVRDV